MFFDTHVHFEQRDGEQGYRALIRRAREAGVSRILAVGSSTSANQTALAAARDFPDIVHAAIGLDRDSVGADAAEVACSSLVASLRDRIGEAACRACAVSAIGEIGLDFHYSADSSSAQVGLFRAQLDLAREFQLPVIVHSREAEQATLDCLVSHVAAGSNGATGVLHCFTGNWDFARRLVDIGFYVSFSGIVTFRNADMLRDVARRLPLERLLIETDTPYLAPVPHRGRRNEPAFIRHVADTIAQLRNSSIDSIAETTTENARRLFGV